MESGFVRSFILSALAIVRGNSGWMGWNLFLALIPLGLSWMLFWLPARRGTQGRSFSPLWWVGVLVFVAFLPNAPYVLTDVIHLVQHIRQVSSIWLVILVLIPLYLAFFLVGFEAYVLSLVNLGYYLKRRGMGWMVPWVELVLHGLSAIGVYLGRFLRFNSWDLLTRLDTVATSVLEDVLGKHPLSIIALTFALITGLYWLMKQISLAVLAYRPPVVTNSLQS